jgi:hypothetical protein
VFTPVPTAKLSGKPGRFTWRVDLSSKIPQRSVEIEVTELTMVYGKNIYMYVMVFVNQIRTGAYHSIAIL